MRMSSLLAAFACALLDNSAAAAGTLPQDQLLRLSYDSAATAARREYFVYLPVGYEADPSRAWPVMLFLHGNGERGNGLDELDYVLQHGPLREAWIQRRPLPFIIISPQLPLFGEVGAVEHRGEDPKPARLETGVPERNFGFPSDQPIQRTSAAEFPAGMHDRFEPYPSLDKLPAGWDRIDDELISMLDTVLRDFRADAKRVYLTGLSMGAFGSFHLAARYPGRWAAMVTVAGTGNLQDAATFAQARLPIWMFGGGKDTLINPHWLFQMARALEEAG